MTIVGETVVSTRVVVELAAIRDALTACMLSAGKDATLPTLMSVQVVKRGGELLFFSTDRFRLTRVTVTLDADDIPSPDWTVLVPVADVKRLLSGLPKAKARGGNPPVALEYMNDGGRDMAGHAVNGVKVTCDRDAFLLQGSIGDFPRVESLIPANDSDTVEMTEIGFDPAYMADLCKMPGRAKGDTAWLRCRGAGKAFVSEWGGDGIEFTYLLMPRKRIED